MYFGLSAVRQIKLVLPNYFFGNPAAKQCLVRFSRKCPKHSAAKASQIVWEKNQEGIHKADHAEVLMIKNLLAGNRLNSIVTTDNKCNRDLSSRHKIPCKLEYGHCMYRHQLLWQDILMGSGHFKMNGKINKTKHDEKCPKKHPKEGVATFKQNARKTRTTLSTERLMTSGPTPGQLSSILLQLREDLPQFFDGNPEYSMYSENILFINKLTRTTTRTLKSYKCIMNVMSFAGRTFWTRPSFDILRITKHSEDNTIKVRWTAKGIPWHQVVLLILSGKPESLFYRYVDGFSIFEVGRDGLIHCHRLDKVIPTSSSERPKWSIRMHILGLIGLGELARETCKAFHVKTKDVIRK